MHTPDDIVDTLNFFDSWEDRYRYIIDLGKELPAADDSHRRDDLLVPGCQSQVWIDYQFNEGRFHFTVDSDAHIVRGLLAIVMAAYQDKTPEEILAFDIEDYFERLDLRKHLSPTRGNGLKSMVEKIKQIASSRLA